MTRRVLVVSDVSAEQVHGGAERMLFHHLRALVQAGFQVTALTRQPKQDATLLLELPDLGVMEHRLPFSGDKGYAGLKQLKIEAFQWWQEHEGQFDCVVSEQPFVMWALLKAGCTLPRLQVCHSLACEEYETRYGLKLDLRKRLVIAAMKKIEKLVYTSASNRLVLSAYTRQKLEDFSIPAYETDIVPGAAEAVDAEKIGQRDTLRNQLGWDKQVIVTLRNLVPRTGVDLMVQMTAILKARGHDLQWLVMGDGILRESMQKLAQALDVQDEVEFTGFLDEQDVQQRMAAADVFVLPTRGLEGFGLVTLEANTLGLPVLATPIAANKELVPMMPFNRVAEDASPYAMALALEWMLEHPLTLAQRERLREESLEQFNWEKHDQQFIRLVEQLV